MIHHLYCTCSCSLDSVGEGLTSLGTVCLLGQLPRFVSSWFLVLKLHLLARLLHAFGLWISPTELASTWQALFVEDNRFVDNYGTPGVPSEREIDDTPPSLVMRVIFWCLFSAPSVNLRDIRTMTREAVIYSQWETWMQKMTNEWTEFVAFVSFIRQVAGILIESELREPSCWTPMWHSSVFKALIAI